jgi:hypothetical protein
MDQPIYFFSIFSKTFNLKKHKWKKYEEKAKKYGEEGGRMGSKKLD